MEKLRKYTLISIIFFILIVPIFLGIYQEYLVIREFNGYIVLILIFGFIIFLIIGKLIEIYAYNEDSIGVIKKQDIINVIQLLEDFWRNLDGTKLKVSNKILKNLFKQQKDVLEPLKSIQEATEILNLLFQYYSLDSERRKYRIAQKIYRSMREMDTFQCYTSYNVWDLRSFEMIKQRIEWWTDSGIGLFDPKSYPWNSHLKGKNNLVDSKEDAFFWME